MEILEDVVWIPNFFKIWDQRTYRKHCRNWERELLQKASLCLRVYWSRFWGFVWMVV